MTLICCLFKAQSCLLNNFQMFTLGCLKVLLISSHNSSPWSGSLVITKRNTDTLISCPHVKYCFSRALYLPAVATSWQSLAWCLISTPWCSPWDVAGARCQGLVTFWDGAANSYVFSLTPHPGVHFAQVSLGWLRVPWVKPSIASRAVDGDGELA